jgi:hypothetical protein
VREKVSLAQASSEAGSEPIPDGRSVSGLHVELPIRTCSASPARFASPSRSGTSPRMNQFSRPRAVGAKLGRARGPGNGSPGQFPARRGGEHG